MKIHILGICGTFMGSLAILASKAGFQVSGQDAKIYPPMSTQLIENNIAITDEFAIEDMPKDVDLVVIGNVMRRGMPIIEYVLDQRLPFVSGPEFLAKYLLNKQHVLAVTGTHGKTTTSSLLAWILTYAGLEPGFLIGGVPNNFGLSAELGAGKYFVVEGDEYDCAFFDKRSKFLHYQPQTLIINNIEFDHADIFANLDAIITQFHHLVRMIPSSGLIVYRNDDQNIHDLLAKGCWSKTATFASNNADWDFKSLGDKELPFSLLGEHNKLNALAAIAAASNVGVSIEIALAALQEFKGVKRRLEIKGSARGITVYSDFAHHPTAIDTTLAGLRKLIGADKRIIAIVDICSNTMKAGTHQDTLAHCVKDADVVHYFHATELSWDVKPIWTASQKPGGVWQDKTTLLSAMLPELREGDYVLLMSNGSFEDFAHNLVRELNLATV